MTENGEMMAVEDLFAGGGEMGALMRSHDWSKTPLGSIEHWSQSLKTAVRIMLTSRQPMFVWWGEELINLYNDAYKAIVGGKHPQALGQPASQVWREIWDQVGPRAESAILNNEGTYDEALLLIMERNGYPEETYYTFSYSPVPDDQGNTGGIICANTDDTQRIISERQLVLLRELAARTAEARTFDRACTLSASCLETNPYDLPFAMIYLVDPDRQYISLAGTCGINRNHAAVPAATVAFDSDAVWSFAEAIKTHQPCLVSNLAASFGSLPTGAWQRSPHQAVVVPIAPSGQTGRTGILVVGLNPFRLFDDNYQRFIDLVAAQISASIANANAYEEERKRAEALAELDRAKTTFFSNVSHEFRTPLTLMLGPLEELLTHRSETLAVDDREQLETVHRNSLRLLKLVNTLLDFSRVEAGRIQAVYEPTDLSALTAELASVFRAIVEQAGLRLIVDCPPLPEPVYIDRQMWEKVIFNLLSNAFKFTFEGEIAVCLRWSDNSVELEVQDTGIGIPSEEIPHLFERFHRVKGAQGRSFEGSGIGLSLVQELVRLQGGTVAVTSAVGKGSCFTVSIPTGAAHLPLDRTGTPRSLASTAIGATSYIEEALRWLPEPSRKNAGGGEALSLLPSPTLPARILLADDNADMRDYVKRLLTQRYEVEAVADGVVALAAIRQNLPDLVLTDVMMPGMDGFELLRSLRSDPTTQEIPIILLSARAGEEARIEGLEAGADDYLIKPFSARELLARVEANLKLAQLRQAAAQQAQALRLAAEAAKEQVEAILSSIRDGFFVLDRDWRYTYVNDRLLEIIGMPRADVIGQSVWELFPEAVGSELYQHLQQAMSQQTPVHFETLYSPWSRWFENRVYPNLDGSLSVFCTNITERKQAEHRLQLYADVVRSTQAGIVVWQLEDLDDAGSFRLLIANPAASEATGVEFEQLIGTTMAESFPVLLQTSLVQQYVNVVRTGQALDLGQVSYSEDGIAAGIYSLKAFPLPDYCLGLAFENITARKQIEAQLQESQYYSQQIVEAMPGILFVQDLLEQRNVYTSRQILDLLGYTPEQIQAMGSDVVSTIVHPDDLACLSAYFEAFRSAPEDTVLGVEYRVHHASGEWRWIYSQSVVFNRTLEGLPDQILGVSLDITDRKQAEAEREQLLAREQAAREQAETANRIKDEFLAVLSHELRSPLNPILGWTKLLQTRKFDQQGTKRALETIERNAKLQTQLIEDLLDISRILRGKMVLNVCPVNLVPTIQAALETVRLAAEAKGIKIQTDFAADLEPVAGDSARLQQIVWNLLANAIKFTPEGGSVEVQLQRVGTETQITVKDTGKGIRPEFLPYVFEYFRQEDSTTTRKFGGLGLGLAIVRYLTELHGGTVKVESQGEGLGATFIVRLPVLRDEGGGMKDEAQNALLLTPDSSPLIGLRILVVDNEVDMQELVLTILEQAGASVMVAASAAEALAAFDSFTPDVLISDIGMPGVDGYTLMRQIRQRSQAGGNILAIALTAYAAESDEQQAIAAGFQRHLAKPVEPEELIKVIVQLIQHST